MVPKAPRAPSYDGPSGKIRSRTSQGVNNSSGPKEVLPEYPTNLATFLPREPEGEEEGNPQARTSNPPKVNQGKT